MAITKINSLGVNLTSPTTFSAGTASLPSITFSGDTNTGLFSTTADTIGFTNGGVNSVTINQYRMFTVDQPDDYKAIQTENKNASFTNTSIASFNTRSANSAYKFYEAVSNAQGSPSDSEFNLRGDGNAFADGTWSNNGADYAEYMTKAGDFVVAKGDVVGINAQGKLTNVFADAVSFVVKSTDPSYVGGDVWGNEEALGLTKPQVPNKREATEELEAETEEEFAVRQTQYEANKAVFDAALEMARQQVDRIAFAGQVPVNVFGAIAGQYIIPVNDNGAIKGEAVSNPTFEQYQIAVGKVIALEPDGRAKIIVKVA